MLQRSTHSVRPEEVGWRLRHSLAWRGQPSTQRHCNATDRGLLTTNPTTKVYEKLMLPMSAYELSYADSGKADGDKTRKSLEGQNDWFE